jgi:hypothetical protein
VKNTKFLGIILTKKLHLDQIIVANGVRLHLIGAAEVTNPFVQPPDDTWVNVEQRWNYADREKLKHSEKIVCQCHSVRHKSYVDCPNLESGPPRWEPVTKGLSSCTTHEEVKSVLIWRISLYHVVHTTLSSRIVSRNMKIKLYKTLLFT